jgi:hypothetical protein
MLLLVFLGTMHHLLNSLQRYSIVSYAGQQSFDQHVPHTTLNTSLGWMLIFSKYLWLEAGGFHPV